MGKTAERLFNERQKRIQDAIALKVPDRVPIMPFDTGWCYKYTGTTFEEAHYDYDKRNRVRAKTIQEVPFDAFSPSNELSGTVYDLLDFRQIKWAGAKRESSRVGSTSIFQFVEPGTGYEEMTEEDYDWFLDDPSDYLIRGHLPKICGICEPFKNLPPMRHLVSYNLGLFSILSALGSPDAIKAIEALREAAIETRKMSLSTVSWLKEMKELGFPALAHGSTYTAFDYLADMLRGTRGAMVDMYRNPDKLKQALERITPWMIAWGINNNKGQCSATGIDNPRVIIPLHKGAGGFMSNAQYEEFYWPTLRQLIIGLIDAGLTPYVYTEGVYTERLPIINDVPKGKILYNIEVDIFEAKKILGDTACLVGGPPSSLMNTGSPEEVKEYCRKLIDVVGEGGGFIMGVQLPLLTDKVENVKALVNFTQEYGLYN